MPADDTPDSGFLSRWSRRKALVRSGEPVAAEPLSQAAPLAPVPSPLRPLSSPMATTPALAEHAVQEPPADGIAQGDIQTAPPPTLADVAALTRDSDYSAFVARGVTPDVRNAALKKLFTDPHFNVMDGLDIYIDDYGIPDPLPEGMLRKMVQSKMLRLFDDDPEEAPAATAAAPPTPAAAPDDTAPDTATPELNTPDEDLAVQLQPDPAAGRPGPEQGAGEDPGRQH